jgi:hypothetical protein
LQYARLLYHHWSASWVGFLHTQLTYSDLTRSLSHVPAGGGTAEQAEDDYLNEVMASSEAELTVYQQIDAQYERDRVEKWRALHGTLGECFLRATYIYPCFL